jgi:hypothetical protein
MAALPPPVPAIKAGNHCAHLLACMQVISVPCISSPPPTAPSPPPPPPSPPLAPGEANLTSYISKTLWAEIFKHVTDPACKAASLYTYENFIQAATKFYPEFATSSDAATNKRELAAFLAQISHETTGGSKCHA